VPLLSFGISGTRSAAYSFMVNFLQNFWRRAAQNAPPYVVDGFHPGGPCTHPSPVPTPGLFAGVKHRTTTLILVRCISNK
jgi:hypothetical protein